VTTEEAQKYAASVGLEYFETSSKNNTNIQEAFEALYSKILKHDESEPDATKSESGAEKPVATDESPERETKKTFYCCPYL